MRFLFIVTLKMEHGIIKLGETMLINDKEYLELLDSIKKQVNDAQKKAIISVNKELIMLYWNIGKIINEKSEWGNKFVENLERDLRLNFPKGKGFSLRNLKYMAKFANEYTNEVIVQQTVAQLPWGQNIVIMDKIKNEEERWWYINKTIENGWSRAVLLHQIELDLYKRQIGTTKVNNFKNTLPKPQSDLVQQVTKDPYIFDFISNADDLYESQLEQALVENVTKLLLELGTGFAFVGNQYKLEVGEDDFYIDMLFYNLNLRCYVVVELKTTEFKPEYAGKLNFYLSAVDGQLKKEGDNPTIGLLLCKSKNNIVAEYALNRMTAPMGVSEYKLSGKLPKDMEKILPSAEDIKTRIKF